MMKPEKPYKLALIAALGPNNELGLDNQLLWHISEDLRHFKAMTMGSVLLMGRKTFLSLKKPLPGRINIMLSRSDVTLEQGLELAARHIREQDPVLQPTLEQLPKGTLPTVYVIGGEQIYRQTLQMADVLYITHVQAPLPEGGADVFFPEIDPAIWQETARTDHESGAIFPYPFSFVTYERRVAGE